MKEPNNPVDAKVVAFVCHVDQEWKRIGYAVQEALDDVHSAMDEKKILDVQFDWIKYVVHFKRSGWYA